ncbi:hypothetical protein GH714_006822 [Hevea brasiliensis]|uniref:Transposase-associated domain-containing protein n=1 Tax=Hevea brasiliensis TaxID=3981 RepID=A0A6A6L955_HEVBR|nr:hypothetical protein GH714_006822 [Hevea brasiliensis]
MGIENRKDPRYIHGVKGFLTYTFRHESIEDAIPCPCLKCRNVNYKQKFEVSIVGEEPKGDATTFYHLLREAKEKLHPECELSKLAAIVKLLHMKSFHRWTNRSFDDLLGLLRKLIPNGKQNLPESYSSAQKRSGQPLGRGEYHLLTDDWKQKTHLYILNTCEEVWPYVEKYKGSLPNISNRELMRRYNSEFPNWFFNHDDVCELVDDNKVYQEEENDMQGRPTRPIDNDDDIVDLNRVDVNPEEVMASVSKRKKNNRKMPPGLKSCISSAHGDSSEETLPPSQLENLSDFVTPEDGWRQVSRSNTVCKLTSVNRIVRIQRQSSPTSNIGKKRQLFRANFNHAPPTIIDAPSLSSPPLSIIEESRQSLITNIKNDPVDDYFDVSPESPEKWKKLEEMQKYSSDDERLQHVPEGLTVDTWKEMFKVFANEDFQEEMQRIEKQPTNDNETGPTPDDILKEVFGIRSGYVRGKGLGYKASTRGMACGSRNEELNELRDEVARLNACLKEQEQRNNEIAQLNARLKNKKSAIWSFLKDLRVL